VIIDEPASFIVSVRPDPDGPVRINPDPVPEYPAAGEINGDEVSSHNEIGDGYGSDSVENTVDIYLCSIRVMDITGSQLIMVGKFGMIYPGPVVPPLVRVFHCEDAKILCERKGPRLPPVSKPTPHHPPP